MPGRLDLVRYPLATLPASEYEGGNSAKQYTHRDTHCASHREHTGSTADIRDGEQEQANANDDGKDSEYDDRDEPSAHRVRRMLAADPSLTVAAQREVPPPAICSDNPFSGGSCGGSAEQGIRSVNATAATNIREMEQPRRNLDAVHTCLPAAERPVHQRVMS